MTELYPKIKDNYKIHLTADECYLFNVVKDETESKKLLGLKVYNQWNISRLLVEYLKLCNGRHTHKDIINKLNIPFEFIGDSILNSIIRECNCIYLQEFQREEESIVITGDYDGYFPLHMSIEITDNCNFRCKHCYISASPDKVDYMTLENFIYVADLLENNGVKVIEITGGEATTHKDFREIIKYASKKFNLVALITNGYVIGEDNDLVEYLNSFNNVCVQVSLDGREEFHDYFRNKKGAYKAACKGIKKLKDKGIMVRLAMSVTEENVDDVEYVFKLAKKLNVDSFATTIISDFGRAANNPICPNKNKELNEKINKSLEAYVNDPLFNAAKMSYESLRKDKEINCGAGWRSFALNGASGNVRSCLFLSSSFNIGNIYRDNYNNIFSRKTLDKYRFSPAPSPFLESCKNCEKIFKCNGCIAHALKVNEENIEKCNWYNKYYKD